MTASTASRSTRKERASLWAHPSCDPVQGGRLVSSGGFWTHRLASAALGRRSRREREPQRTQRAWPKKKFFERTDMWAKLKMM